MMRSLYSGVAGLKTHQTKMDVIGNNIANVNTTSFKSQSITFSDLMYQTTQTASGATETKGGVNARQIGLGAKSGAINTAITSQGATQTTNNPFDIMITGEAFFVVNNGNENLYTRDGSFYVDGAGNLAMQSNGYLVQGWVAQEDKDTGEITINKNGGLSALQIMSADNNTYSPASTTAALYSGNIDDHDSNIVSDDGKTITLEFYDNKGYLYTGKFTLKDTGTDHLFSLELTDIIDSEGNTINKTLTDGTKTLDHITLGEAQSKKNIEMQKGYYLKDITTDPTTNAVMGTIYQKAGVTAFSDVPATGNDISKLSDIPNFISKVYPSITDLTKYSSISGYEITSSSLNITFNSEDSTTTIKNKTYKNFYEVAEGEGYFYRSSDNYAYKAPSTDGGNLGDLKKELLTEIYEIDATSPLISGTTGNKNFTYTFNEGTGALTVTAQISNLDDTDDQYESATKLAGGKYDSLFVNKDSSNTYYGMTISEILKDATVTSTYTKGTTYKYTEGTGKIVLAGTKEVDVPNKDADSVQVTNSYSNLVNALKGATKGNLTYPGTLTTAQQAALKTAVTDNAPTVSDTVIQSFNYTVTSDGAADPTYTIKFGGSSNDAYKMTFKASENPTLATRLDGATTFDSNDLANWASADTGSSDTYVGYITNIAFDDPSNYDMSFKVNTSGDGYTLTFDNAVAGSFDVNLSNTSTGAYAVLYSMLDNYTISNITYGDLSDTAKAELKTLIDPNGAFDDTSTTIEFTKHSLTGTEGYIINVKNYTGKEDVTETLATFDKYNEIFTNKKSSTYSYANANSNPNPYGIFMDNATNTGYVVFDKDTSGGITLDEIELSVIQKVFGNSITSKNDLKGDYKTDSTLQDSDFKVTFTTTEMSVSHSQTDEIEMNIADYKVTIKDGKATYVTASDTKVYPDPDKTSDDKFNLSGNITNLLEASSGGLQNLLKSVYNIDDDDARAFGTTGIYEIDPSTAKITLKTGSEDGGNKTIQLLFNAANGSLVDANGNPNGMVTLNFDQSIDGLEAFGYQESSDQHAFGDLDIDFSTLTNYNTNGASTIKVVKGDKKSLNTGRAVGEMNGVSVSTDGQIYATYSNGQTKLLGQIASAEFANASGLSKEGDNLYSSTLNSGEATIQDITTDGGYMNTGVLEMSNVDLSSQFTEMITTQRGFQANSRIITVSDTLLEELTNLKR